MVQTSTDTTTGTYHKKNLPSSPLVEITRTFYAPVERVWKAWSDPELIKEWWGPVGYSCPRAKMDFREGGKYLFAMQGPDGNVIWSTGVFEEIIPMEKIVWTDQFCDKDGKPLLAKDVGIPGEWPDKLYVTIEFEGLNNNQTIMIISHEGIPKEMHDDCVEGWKSSVDKLQKLVERN